MIEFLAQFLILFLVIAFSCVAIAGNFLKQANSGPVPGAADRHRSDRYVAPTLTLRPAQGQEKSRAA